MTEFCLALSAGLPIHRKRSEISYSSFQLHEVIGRTQYTRHNRAVTRLGESNYYFRARGARVRSRTERRDPFEAGINGINQIDDNKSVSDQFPNFS